jgi:hypothetical protein
MHLHLSRWERKVIHYNEKNNDPSYEESIYSEWRLVAQLNE